MAGVNDFFHDISSSNNKTTALIAAFVCTLVAIVIATMFSCFGKKKNKKKNKEDKKNAPLAAPCTQTPGVTVEVRPPADHDTQNHSNNVDNLINDAKRVITDAADSKESNEASPGDFSAVQETEILRSYRKAPPPQNRARQSRAPRALKSSAENLDIFGELDKDQLYEINKDSTIKPCFEDINAKPPKVDSEAKDGMEDSEDKVKKRGSSQGRSSMLDEINNTLASIHSNVMNTSTEAKNAVDEKEEEVQDEITSKLASTVNEQAEEKVKDAEKLVQDKVQHVERSAEEKMQDVGQVVEDKENNASAALASREKKIDLKTSAVTAPVSSLIADKVSDSVNVKEEAVGEVEKHEKEAEEKVNGFKTSLVEKSAEVQNEVTSQFESIKTTVKETVDQIDISQIACEVKETIQSKVADALPILKTDENQGKPDSDDGKLPNNHEAEIFIDKSLNGADIAFSKMEKKIPPKVSPKPSPKFKLKHEASAPVSLEISTSQESEVALKVQEENADLISSAVEELQEDNPAVEKMDTPPQSPTSPTSPTMKGGSRIPMSKKSSGIPKLSFNSSKPQSASPISSPDAAGKKLDQAKEIIQKVEKEVENIDDEMNHSTPATNSEQLDSEIRVGREMSPSGDDNQGSKRKLTKLRYSNRKKSSESKSDESGSDRGSRAGSEAKSEDGKKPVEEVDVEKKCRIPVRGGSKPRSSPPKTLGN